MEERKAPRFWLISDENLRMALELVEDGDLTPAEVLAVLAEHAIRDKIRLRDS